MRHFVPRIVISASIVLVLTVAVAQTAQAQTYTVIHDFTGLQDGANPIAGLTIDIDKSGSLYGTAQVGGSGSGTAYRLAHKGSGWTFSPLYNFAGGSDGAYPSARVILGPDGLLYGTTKAAGACCGTVFKLRPSPTVCKAALCPWTKTVLYSFKGGADGNGPLGDLVFQAGNIYGTTGGGGSSGDGTVYELTPSGSAWTESVLYSFAGSDGAGPSSGVIFDNAGNLNGTTEFGGNSYGTVFELTNQGSNWTQSFLYSFQNGSDGARPGTGLIPDASGNFYGATIIGGSGGGGTVFELSPSGDSFTLKTLYNFAGSVNCGPQGNLVMNGGSLYGTTVCNGAHNLGSVFKLTLSGGIWTYTSLHDFTGGSDGGNPYSNVVFDVNGDLYGTAYIGGTSQNCSGGCGVVWEITP